jgi:hypothetical protein
MFQSRLLLQTLSPVVPNLHEKAIVRDEGICYSLVQFTAPVYVVHSR